MSRERQSRSRDSQRQYDEREWDEQRERFREYYIDRNKTLKEAAQCMRDTHNFDASLRQWERRISPAHWNLTKYVSKEARIKQVERSGRSLHEISAPGRRPMVRKNGVLKPSVQEDRNLRRFARRHLGTSPSGRPRALSLGDISYSREDSRESSLDQDELDGNDDDTPVDDVVYTIGMPDDATMQGLNSGLPPDVLNLPATRVMMNSNDAVQMHVFRGVEGETSSIPQLMLSLPDDMMNQIPLVPGMSGFVAEQGFPDFANGQEMNQYASPSTNAGINSAYHAGLPDASDPEQYQSSQSLHDMPWPGSNGAFVGQANNNVTQGAFNYTELQQQAASSQGYGDSNNFNVPAAIDFNLPGVTSPQVNIVPTDVMLNDFGGDISEQMLDPLQADFQNSASTYAGIVHDEVQRLILSTPGIANSQDLLSKLLSSLNLRRNLFVGEMTSIIDGHTKAQQRNTQGALTRLRQRNVVLESVLRYRGIDISSTLAEMRQPMPVQNDPTLTFYNDIAEPI